MTRTFRPISSHTNPDRCEECTLRGSRLCRVATSHATHVQPARLRRFERDAPIFAHGDMAAFLGVLRRGYLRQERLIGDASRTLISLAFPGDIVGALPGQRATFSLEAATDAEICAFDAETVRRMVKENAQFRMHILREASRRLERKIEMIWQRGALNARERVIAFLAMAASRMSSEPQPDGSVIVTVELSRADWADIANTAVETVSRTLSELCGIGVIESLARFRYQIHDLDQLSRLAGLDPEYELGGATRPPKPAILQLAAASKRARPLTAVNAQQRHSANLGRLKFDAAG